MSTADQAAVTAERPAALPSLDRLAARALALPGSTATRSAWSEAAKDRLYQRMFPDQPTHA